MSDEPNIPSVPDPLRGEPMIDVEDPLLPAFSFQFDMRERFLAAMRDAIELLRNSPDPIELRCERALAILDNAIDPEDVQRWNKEGRPLPSLPDIIAERGLAIDNYVGALYRSVGLDRFNIWGYDARHDDWFLVDETLAVDEARRTLAERDGNAPTDVEYLMLPVGEDPSVSTL
jgi:hypothetical protein